MKQGNKSLNLKHIFSTFLAILFLFSSIFVPSGGKVNADTADGTLVPSIYVKRADYNPHLVQKVYLEPETEYVFSYLYSNLPANVMRAAYSTTDIDNHCYKMGKKVYSSKENRVSVTFTTVSLDADGVVKGTDANADKIESYVGIQMYRDYGEDYLNGNSLYGGFMLYKKSDTGKTNIFTDTSFSNIALSQGAEAKWTSLPPTSADFAALNFGVMSVSSDVYTCLMEDKTVKLNNTGSRYFAQTLYLKPATEYTLSYYYTKDIAAGVAAFKNATDSYAVSSPIYDKEYKKVTYRFTTAELTDSNVIVGTDENAELLKTVVGLDFGVDKAHLAGGSYSDLFLCEAGTGDVNLFEDARFSSIGILGDAVWHGVKTNADASNSVEKNTEISSDAFLKKYFIGAKNVTGGTIKLSSNYALPGEIITAKPVADTNYSFISGTLKVNGTVITPENGVYSFTCPYEDAVLSAEFAEKSEIKAVKVKNSSNPTNPYFVQTVWLEPNTKYVFSYLYNLRAADANITVKGSNEESFTKNSDVDNTDKKTVTVSFTTCGLDDADVTKGTDANEGKIMAMVGIRLWNGSTDLVNNYFADFRLYKKDDTAQTNIFVDTEYSSIGNINNNFKWHGLWAVNTNIAYTRETVDYNSYFATEYSKDTLTVKSVTTVENPYFVQSVWLKPNTKYVFSYLYSNRPADDDIAVKGTNEKRFTRGDRVLEEYKKKVTRTFTTCGLDDADVTKGTGVNEGKIMAMVGIRLWKSSTDLVGSYFADFELYEENDADCANVFSDTGFSSIGKISDGRIWHALWNSDANLAYGRATVKDSDLFLNRLSVTAKPSEFGTLSFSTDRVCFGCPAYAVGLPNDGYRLSGATLSNGETVTARNGNISFIMPDTSVEVTGSFKPIIKADCNGDDNVDTLDLVCIKKYLSNINSAVIPENSDCNKDCVINSQDLACVVKSILGIVYGVDLIPITGGVINNTFNGAAIVEADALKAKILGTKDSLSITGTTYYVSENGSDYNNGLTETTPIKSFAKLETLDLKSGDGVLFERGSTFRLPYQYYCVNGVSYGAYGEGEKPKIYGSERNYADASIWHQSLYENVWRVDLTKYSDDKKVNADAGIIVFNGGETVGTKQMNSSALLENGYFYYSVFEQSVYLYCDKGNPGEVYESIEIGRRGGIFKIADNVKIDNLTLNYTGGHGIGGGDVDNSSVTNCKIGWIGGSTHYDTRYGNGIEFYNGCTNVEISNCWVYQVFDAGITFQGDDETKSYTDIKFAGNLIERCSWSIEWWSGWEKKTVYGFQICDISPISNVSFDSNILRLEGYGWSGTTRDPASIQGPHGTRTYKNLSNFTVTNNIFDCPNGVFIDWRQASNPVAAQEGYTMSGNTYCYADTEDNAVFNLGANGTTYAQNKADLTAAVSLFDKSPSLVEWIAK